MPAVNIRLRWPDGQESTSYSPSTGIYQHLEAGQRYRLDDFLARAEQGLTAASERVKALKGFYCSSALDSLAGLRLHARRFDPQSSWVEVVHLQQQGAGVVHAHGYGDL